MTDDETKIAAFRAAIIEGELSGPSTEFDFDAFIARKWKEHEERTQNNIEHP